MSEEITRDIPEGGSFEQRVFARFDAVDAQLHEMDSRLRVLEQKSYDTKPIWEQALREITETKRELSVTRRELSRRLDRIEAVVLEDRADLHDAQDRIEKLESKLPQ